MTLRNLGIVAVLMLGMAAEAPAQFTDGCSPYNYDGCTPVIEQHRFVNVPVNAPGLEWAFISVHNTSPYAGKVEIHVTLPGRPVRRYKRERALEPGELLEPELLALWPELKGYQGGVSVVVAASQTVMASVALHPAIDTNDPLPIKEQVIRYWRYMKFLEGR
jgi:hypothetical protein